MNGGSVGSGGEAGGATNYLNMVTTPTVVDSSTTYVASTGVFTTVTGATMAAAGIPV